MDCNTKRIYDKLIICNQTCPQLILPLILQLDSNAESEPKEESEDDYAMNSESYLEVSHFVLNSVKDL